MSYPNQNDTMMEPPIDKEIIQGVMDKSASDDDNCVLPNIFLKEMFEAIFF